MHAFPVATTLNLGYPVSGEINGEMRQNLNVLCSTRMCRAGSIAQVRDQTCEAGKNHQLSILDW